MIDALEDAELALRGTMRSRRLKKKWCLDWAGSSSRKKLLNRSRALGRNSQYIVARCTGDVKICNPIHMH